MSTPTIAEQLKCKFVATELPKIYNKKLGRTTHLVTGIWNLVAYYDPANMELVAQLSEDKTKDVDMTKQDITDFLMGLADEGLDVEKERDGVVWKFVRA
jgi:hypothetical protein